MITRTLTLQRRVLIGILHNVPVVHDLFTCRRIELLVRSVGSYWEDIVRQFYTSYIEDLRGAFDRRAKPGKHTPLTNVRVQGFRVDISFPSILRLLHGGSTNAVKVPLTRDFDYRWDVVKSFHFKRRRESI